VENKRLQTTVIVEKTGTGFSAYTKEIDGLATVGDTIAQLKQNFNEVLGYHVEYLKEQGETVNTDDYEISYVIDLEQFFEYFSVINKSAFAERYVKMNTSLFRQYTKGLAPLSGDKLKKISEGLHRLAEEIDGLSLA
jgi:predicted RNase H-like HicB family nuclease